MTLSKVTKGERVVTPELVLRYDWFLLYNHIQRGNTSSSSQLLGPESRKAPPGTGSVVFESAERISPVGEKV